MEQPIPSSAPAAAPVENDIGIDIDKLIADTQAPTPAAASDDFSDLERQIQALLSGESVEADSIQPVDRKIAEQALEQASVDPLMQEIDAALSDDADSDDSFGDDDIFLCPSDAPTAQANDRHRKVGFHTTQRIDQDPVPMVATLRSQDRTR